MQAKRVSVHHDDRRVELLDLRRACAELGAALEGLPYCYRVLLENALRRADWESAGRIARREIGAAMSFLPARVLLQDLLGVPVLVDLSSMRDAAAALGARAQAINPRLPVDLVIDHSLIPVQFGTDRARAINEATEMRQNRERFRFLRWCQTSFERLRVIPPGKGILHQINLEYLARVFQLDAATGLAFPDTVYGTDSHTPMVNGLGILGWGVGGLEAETAMLGRASTFPVPEVLGVELVGRASPGVTATDIVLTITQRLRAHGVVGKFIEFTGERLKDLPVADRATIANMAPEYGATCVYFPIDRQTVTYLALSGRESDHVELVERCAHAQGLWRDDRSKAPAFDSTLAIDLGEIVPSIAGPKRPEDRVALAVAHQSLAAEFALEPPTARHPVPGERFTLGSGDIVIAAITSCTNTSNPAAVVAAALLARNAVERGLSVKPWVKTTFAPGSQVVGAYLQAAGLQRYLDALGFNVVGFGCTTCNGGSGPLGRAIGETIEAHDLTCVAALSGNRNFPGRIHPSCRASYIMSPPLVVAYALAGSIRRDISSGPVGTGPDGRDVYLADIWPTDGEIARFVERSVTVDAFAACYADVARGSEDWDGLDAESGTTYDWEPTSTYLKRVPYFDEVSAEPAAMADLLGLRPLVVLGDSITTDHISPSGAIVARSAAGQYLHGHGISSSDFNTFGTRRGNHEVVMRSAFANNRLHNEMTQGKEGSITVLMPDGLEMSVFDAALEYQSRGVGLIVIAGEAYGCGSSRDTAAKSVKLLGVRAVVAQSYERIHRTNLVGMGILPLEFMSGENRKTLGLTGGETFDVLGLEAGLQVAAELELRVHYRDERTVSTEVIARLDTPDEIAYMQHGGVLPCVFREMVYSDVPRGGSRAR